VTFTCSTTTTSSRPCGPEQWGVEQMLAPLAPDVTVLAAGMTELGADEEVEW
jgi:hypothetical protein